MHNLTEILDQFKAAMREQGIEPPNIKADGQLHRFHIKGHKSGTLNGAYKLHIDGIKPAGFFQDYQSGLKTNWKLDGETKEFTPEEKRRYAEAMRQKQEQAAMEQAIKHANAARQATQIWQKAALATVHPYLTKKRIQAHGTKLHNNTLVIPLYNDQKRIVSLQFISATGEKRFLPGGQKKGCFWWIGKPGQPGQQPQKILICEGFATGASLHQATGYQTFIAFDAGNLAPVAAIIRANKPEATIIICADNDTSGRGQEAANDAALTCNGLIAMPPKPGTDFNDFVLNTQGEGSHDGQ